MKVLCIGHASYDISMFTEGFPKENTKYRLNDKVECPGGPALTASLLLGSWGVDTYFSGIIGNDYYGNEIKKELINREVNYDYLVESNDVETTKTFILVNKFNASRTVFNTISEVENLDIDYAIIPDIILMDGENYNLSIKAIEKFPNSIKVMDAGKVTDKVTKLCSKSDYIICSKEFAELVTKIRIDFDDPNSFKLVLNKLNDMYKANVIITLENQGCLYKLEDKIQLMSGIKVHTIDTTSAGDIFHGAFIYGLTKNLPLEKCLKIANIAAGLSVKIPGSSNSIPDIMKVHSIYEKNK